MIHCLYNLTTNALLGISAEPHAVFDGQAEVSFHRDMPDLTIEEWNPAVLNFFTKTDTPITKLKFMKRFTAAEYKTLRATNESVRPYNAFLEAIGNEKKNADGSKRTPRFLRLLAGTKLVIPAGVTQLNVTGELLTDDGSDPFDRSLVTGALIIDYTPAASEVIKVTASGNEYSLAQISAAVVSALQGTTIPADTQKIAGQPIYGNGRTEEFHT